MHYATSSARYGGGEFTDLAVVALDYAFKYLYKEITNDMLENEKSFFRYHKEVMPIVADALKPEFQNTKSFREHIDSIFVGKVQPVGIELLVPATVFFPTEKDFEHARETMIKFDIKSEDSAYRLFHVNNQLKIPVPPEAITGLYDVNNDMLGKKMKVTEYLEKKSLDKKFKFMIPAILEKRKSFAMKTPYLDMTRTINNLKNIQK